MSVSVAFVRRSTLALALVALSVGAAACHGKPEPPIGAAPAERAPLKISSATGPFAFIGRWAATASACGRQSWTLASDALRSPSALSCSFDKVIPTDAGYMVYGVCEVGKAKAPGTLMFTMTGRGATRSLTLSGGPFNEPVALARCPSGGEGPDAGGLQAASTTQAVGG